MSCKNQWLEDAWFFDQWFHRRLFLRLKSGDVIMPSPDGLLMRVRYSRRLRPLFKAHARREPKP